MSEHDAVRCAIYTRKSTDEGLDKEFNSLDAQREAGEAYIASQKHEGWVCLPDRYDDGGFTGGNMDRPALSRLLNDIEAGQVDCIVVYKVDRLSRSLIDFARIMDVLERQHVSFVSVTQQFNTSTSMGRLMLNVLLSFAQFEREIISERTRDKIAATRRKGKWTGGIPMLGYDVDARGGRLLVNEDEAACVREIFDLYLDRQSLLETAKELDRRRWVTKRWVTKKGLDKGGKGNGENQTTYYLNSMERDEDRPEIVTKNVRYSGAVTSPSVTTGEETTVDLTYFEEDPNKGIESKTIKRAAIQRTADDSALYYSVEKSVYNEDGNLAWSGWGSEDASGTLGRFFMNHREYDGKGRLTKYMEDVDASFCGCVLPAGWARIAAGDPLHLVTEYFYDDTYGLNQINYPNGRQRHILYETDPSDPMTITMWDFSAVDPATGEVLEPVSVQRYAGGQMEYIHKVAIATTTIPPTAIAYGPEDIISKGDVEYDATGRVTGVTKSDGAGTSSVSANIRFYPNGQPERSDGPDGTISRYSFTKRGFLEKTFMGTTDAHPYWRTLPPSAPEEDYDDNMVLIEKRAYGSGATDADRLVEVRHYNRQVDNQYWVAEPAVPEDDPDWVANNEDAIGWRTVHKYDWRMREAWVKQYGESGNLLRNSLNWYDNLGRVLLAVEYGATVPAGVDPTAIAPGESNDTYVDSVLTTSILAEAGTTPALSITRFLYNDRGLVEETRDYRTDLTIPRYTSTVSYYDYANRPSETHAPGTPIQQFEYDAKKRQIKQVSLAGGVEVTRIDTEYDEADRLIKATRYERKNGASGSVLDNTNAVVTYAFTWYDDAGKVIARADYGTNNGDFWTDASTLVPVRAADAPENVTDLPGALVLCPINNVA